MSAMTPLVILECEKSFSRYHLIVRHLARSCRGASLAEHTQYAV